MIDCASFFEAVVEQKISFFAGVPDSLLKNFCAYVTDYTDSRNHIITANEGNAVALAAGHYLATGRAGLVYMQNSGLGNAVNPLTSLVDTKVYGIPLLLLIGWRGEPGTTDEPQHIRQGEVTVSLLQTLGIDHDVLPNNLDEAVTCLAKGARVMYEKLCPYALVVRRGTFAPHDLGKESTPLHEMVREDAIKSFVDGIGPRDVVVSTTGKTSRELFEYRAAQHQEAGQDFLTVGSMGHASQIALGIALTRSDRQVFCLDGDGALIMHMGALAIIGAQGPQNLKHVVINNGVHDSVGGQPTVGFHIDIPALARACGYTLALKAHTHAELVDQLSVLQRSQGPSLLEVKVNGGVRSDLGRPTTSPIENKESFMRFLQS